MKAEQPSSASGRDGESYTGRAKKRRVHTPGDMQDDSQGVSGVFS